MSGIRTTDFSRLATCAPVNETAGRVVSRGPDQGDEVPNPMGRWHSPTPIPVWPKAKLPQSQGFEDLTGRRFGWLTVVGFLGKSNPKKAALWLVRCTCGAYEKRTAAAVKRDGFAMQSCWKCARTRSIREGRWK